MEKFTILIPTFNEEENIRSIVSRLKELHLDFDILIVNDGSTDKTEEILQSLDGIHFVSHPYNKGNGASVKTGIVNAKTEIIMIIDADGQHDPREIENLLQFIDKYDLVVGARTSKSDTSLFRDFGNSLFMHLGSFLSGHKILDMTSGFRVFRKKHIMKFYNLYPNGFSFPTTSTMSFLMSGLNVKFVPMQFHKRMAGKSKIRPYRDGTKFLLIIFKIIMFNPLKVFIPFAVIFVFLGIVWSIRTISLTSQISAGGLLLLFMGINLFFFGFVFDQIAGIRRDLAQKDINT